MNIDWSKLESCGGCADPSEIPKAIEMLFSPNEDVRETGYWGIDNHAVVQSDLYSAAPYAAQIIVERFLEEKSASYQLIEILFELHNGYGPQMLTVGPLAGKPLDVLCKSIVRKTEPLLLNMLSTLDEDLAEEVNSLLESFNENEI